MTEVDCGLYGKVTNVSKNLGCVAIEVKKGTLRKGDTVQLFKERYFDSVDGHSREYLHKQAADSLEIDHEQVEVVATGKRCGIKIHLPIGNLPPYNCEVTRVPTG